jgi:hypothetical protein
MMTPTIHLNGTSKEALTGALEEACNALFKAQEALGETAPNARDYYVQSDRAFEQARTEHNARADKLREVYTEIQLMWEAILGVKRP